MFYCFFLVYVRQAASRQFGLCFCFRWKTVVRRATHRPGPTGRSVNIRLKPAGSQRSHFARALNHPSQNLTRKLPRGRKGNSLPCGKSLPYHSRRCVTLRPMRRLEGQLTTSSVFEKRPGGNGFFGGRGIKCHSAYCVSCRVTRTPPSVLASPCHGNHLKGALQKGNVASFCSGPLFTSVLISVTTGYHAFRVPWQTFADSPVHGLGIC